MIHVFGHQGGWDEILFVAIPMVLVALLLLLANHRAANTGRQNGEDPSESD